MMIRTLFAFFLAGIPMAHGALLWSYSYSGAGVTGGGYLTTSNTQSGGAYSITGISGNRGALPVEFLLSAGTYPASGGGVLISDNLLYPGSPMLGLGGFTVQAGTDLYNVYNTGGIYYDLAGADCGAATCGQPGHLGTSITFTATLVPSLEWQFAYSGTGVSASGELFALATPVSGHYQIVGLSGLRNGAAMNALFPAGTYSASGGGILISDNFLFPSNPFLDTGGFTFHAGSDRYNVYNTGGIYYDLAGADCGGATCGQPGHLGTPVSFSISQVPEPGSLALMGVAALAMLSVGTRERKKTENTAYHALASFVCAV
jgi:hypothetical protein